MKMREVREVGLCDWCLRECEEEEVGREGTDTRKGLWFIWTMSASMHSDEQGYRLSTLHNREKRLENGPPLKPWEACDITTASGTGTAFFLTRTPAWLLQFLCACFHIHESRPVIIFWYYRVVHFNFLVISPRHGTEGRTLGLIVVLHLVGTHGIELDW